MRVLRRQVQLRILLSWCVLPWLLWEQQTVCAKRSFGAWSCIIGVAFFWCQVCIHHLTRGWGLGTHWLHLMSFPISSPFLLLLQQSCTGTYAMSELHQNSIFPILSQSLSCAHQWRTPTSERLLCGSVLEDRRRPEVALPFLKCGDVESGEESQLKHWHQVGNLWHKPKNMYSSLLCPLPSLLLVDIIRTEMLMFCKIKIVLHFSLLPKNCRLSEESVM